MSAEEKTPSQVLVDVLQLLQRFYESPSLANSTALVLIDEILPDVRKAIDDADWTEKGLAEWRSESKRASAEYRRQFAVSRVAISHLLRVLTKARTASEQQAFDTEARQWLESIDEL